MQKRELILVVDDEETSRKLLREILSDRYDIIEASNGREALSLIESKGSKISLITLDLMMPVMDGMEFLRRLKTINNMKHIPIVMLTGSDAVENETEGRNLGVWDFIKKPYNVEVLVNSISNAIAHSNVELIREIEYREQYDSLTNIYRKNKFLSETKLMLKRNKDVRFAMVHMDINQFQLYNSLFGMAEGDRLLLYIADLLSDMAEDSLMTFGREEADVFYFCLPYTTEEDCVELLKSIRHDLNKYRDNYNLVPAFGICAMNEGLSVRTAMDWAKQAAKECKGNYIKNYAFYSEAIGKNLFKEQLIINSVNTALTEEQFIIYLQPKYELRSSRLEGAEVLVRWLDPDKGMISPGEFIPIFERNGFIMELDYYMWEKSCKLIRRWLDEGKKPYPISVNISRVSLYNPQLVNIISDLVKKYDVPAEYIQFELTESAYNDNAMSIKGAVKGLQEHGFKILMDDFGSGYSSLNALKDLAVDVLKLDMKFMDKCDIPGRSENIIASVIRMAKWLNLPVVAEGVENEEQALFLRSIGCESVQGYFFARPMPVEEYEKLAFSETVFHDDIKTVKLDTKDDLWDTNSQLELMFSTMIQAVAFYEFDKNTSRAEVLRVNDAYYDLLGFKKEANGELGDVLDKIDSNYHELFLNAMRTAVDTGLGECEFERIHENGKKLWLNIKLKYVNDVAGKAIILGMISDHTIQKEVEAELAKFQNAIRLAEKKEKTILIIDDTLLNRVKLREMFSEGNIILEAENGRQAIDIIEEHNYDLDLILVDLVMPVMDGKDFLEYRRRVPALKQIPSIVITSENSVSKQVELLSMGADDYILKPFVPEAVIKRVNNVLDSGKRFGERLQEISGNK